MPSSSATMRSRENENHDRIEGPITPASKSKRKSTSTIEGTI
ncbi:MAG: hypothetical protein RDV41_06080 [Planctomycetota bacterium]|nr:hypothetical protein [Planctomycetota bacterium]